jgi:hypothetical protein
VLAAGRDADIAILEPDLSVVGVLVRAAWCLDVRDAQAPARS